MFNTFLRRGSLLYAPAFSRSYASKDIIFGSEARAAMMRGVDNIAKAVSVTLGPKGRNVLLEQAFGPPKITKDGVTVAKHVEFQDHFENMGAQLVKDVASKTNDVAGDGTTTATVLTRAIFVEGCKAVASGMNPMDLKRGIDLGVSKVIEELQKYSKKINSQEEVEQVATISANQDKDIGHLIASAMAKVGQTGVITIADGKTLENEIDITEGLKFDQGFISPYFITNSKEQKCEFENPFIVICDHKISSIKQIVPALEFAKQRGRKLLIIAESVEGDAMATLIVNKLRTGLQVCAVKAPGFGDNRKEQLQDLAVLTGGKVITEELGMSLENLRGDEFGSAKTVTVTADSTLLLDGAGAAEDLQARLQSIASAIPLTSSEYQREKLKERQARLSGGVAVIKVGGASEIEVNEKKDRITDALNATQAAVEEGIVIGGGCALLYASRSLDTLKTDNVDIKHGLDILKNALRSPAKTIADNAGAEGSLIVGKLLKGNNSNIGYDAQSGQFLDMFKAGIIDPMKVVRMALIDAASIASLMTTTEALVADLQKEVKDK